jgi:beta-lactamase class A
MRGALAAIAALFWVSATPVATSPQAVATLSPGPIAVAEWQPLRDRADRQLQTALLGNLNARPEWRRLIRQQRLAIGLVDLRSSPPRLASVNGDRMMYAASLPKIAILLAAYVSFEDGSLPETSSIHQDLHEMIQVSSNAAATRTIDAVGMRKIEQVMRDPRFDLYDEKRGGGLWVGKRYAATGVRRGDPLYNISHGATANQVARFYYLLASKRLISEARSDQMLADLADPGLHHKFVAALDERAPDAKLFRKSGTWREWHSDSVLVKGDDWRHYILVGLVQSANGEAILRELVPMAEDALRRTSLVAVSATPPVGPQSPP